MFVVSKWGEIPAAYAQKIKQEQHIQKLFVDLPAGGTPPGWFHEMAPHLRKLFASDMHLELATAKSKKAA